ncbi:MAG: PHP domain-containing protein, partial [Rhizobiales bacterium]|nr:PHP domain-containing protein [Hyphomicrobiales bacterium]
MTAYAELAAVTNFSFLRGASHPSEMVDRAGALGLTAIGIADRNSLAGVVRAHDAAKRRKGIRLLVGTRLVTLEGFEAIAYPTDRTAYGRLCRLLSDGNRKAKKGDCLLHFEDLLGASAGQMLIALPPRILDDDFVLRLAHLARKAPARTFLGAANHLHGDAPRRLGTLAELAEQSGAPLVAVNDALYHIPERRRLADILTCIREKCTLAEAGFRLEVNAECHLKSPDDMARLFASHPQAIARSLEIVQACRFSLDELKYEYPDEPVPPGKSPQEHLAHLTWEGARRRYPKRKYPAGIPDDIVKRLRDELAIIDKLDFARYFLTVHDIVAYARECGILCQGRGSAANSAVCYCLGITEVDPNKTQLLFARFISQARGEPPDIDVDFEHERREEVIQYIYKRYGRHRAAICATVIHYRSRRAIGEVGKVLGLTSDITAALSKTVWGSHGGGIVDDQIRQAGLDPRNPAIRQAVELAAEITGFPRHLSQHVGGFVLTRERLDDTVPIGNAAMDDRTFIEWDKDDIDTIGLMKVDVLALGMLSCIKRALTLLKLHHNRHFPTLADLPQDDPAVYEMLSRADSIGVFQVESRAQMSMLPRLKPREFYDLVIEVAIVRPGPIQG